MTAPHVARCAASGTDMDRATLATARHDTVVDMLMQAARIISQGLMASDHRLSEDQARDATARLLLPPDSRPAPPRKSKRHTFNNANDSSGDHE